MAVPNFKKLSEADKAAIREKQKREGLIPPFGKEHLVGGPIYNTLGYVVVYSTTIFLAFYATRIAMLSHYFDKTSSLFNSIVAIFMFHIYVTFFLLVLRWLKYFEIFKYTKCLRVGFNDRLEVMRFMFKRGLFVTVVVLGVLGLVAITIILKSVTINV